MKKIESEIMKEREELERILAETKKRLRNTPAGYLRVANRNGKVQYYLKNDDKGDNKINDKNDDLSTEKHDYNDKKNGRYIRKNERELAIRIAQRDYDKLVLKNVEERIKAIDSFLLKYKKTNLKEIYKKTNTYRRELINPIMLSDEEFVKRWQEVEYEGKAFSDDTQGVITERGEKVRSKSEKIIADKLYVLGIPYRYEYPIVLDGKIKVYPDFTILKMPEREEVYLEHFGMMDDPDYVEKVISKLSIYERNRIYIGINMFVTQETSKNVLNTKALDELIRKLFLEE